MTGRDGRDLAIEASGLVKDFGTTRAVDEVDLVVHRGSVHGFLGPNGAGKTTTLRMLATLLRPDGGTAAVLGHDVVRDAEAVRCGISLTGQFAALDEDLTGLENLVLIGFLRGCGRAGARVRAGELLDAFALGDAADRLVRTYSGGMKRRLDIAASLVVVPEVLFLDEPTTGLDPHSRNQVWEMVRGIVADGSTVLLTTQYLEEADHLAGRITVIDRGRVIAEGTPGELKASVGESALHVRVLDPGQVPAAERLLSRALGAALRVGPDPTALSAQIVPGRSAGATSGQVVGALAALDDAGIAVDELTLGHPSLDEVFLSLTGHRPTPEPDAAMEDSTR